MNRKIPLGLLLLAAAPVVASGPRGTVPKASANRYPSHAEKDGVSVGAALLTSDEVHKTFVSEVNRCCLVVEDRKSTRLNSSHQIISYAVFCLKKKKSI